MTLTLVQFEYAWEIHAYLRTAGIFYEEENCDFFSTKSASNLPYLIDDRYIIEGDQALSYLKENYRDIDLDFSEAERSEIDLLTYFFHTVGEVAINRELWLKASTRGNAVSAVYRPIIGRFYSQLYSSSNYWRYWRHIRRFDSATALSETELKAKLEALYAILDARFASQKKPSYLYGDRASSLDVALFAHLAQVKQFPDTLMYLVDMHPQLMKFYDRFLADYFLPMDNDTREDFSANRFVLFQNIHIQKPDKNFCFTSRKTPYSPSKDDENDKMMAAVEEEDKKNLKWRIASFIGTLILGSFTVVVLDRLIIKRNSNISSL